MSPVPLVTEVSPSSFEGILPYTNLCTIEVTVPTGIEDICAEEVQAKLGLTPYTAVGRVFFDIGIKDVRKVLELKSIEHAHVVMLIEHDCLLPDDREECFKFLYKLCERADWQKGLQVWQKVFGNLQYCPFKREKQLSKSFQEPNPLVDLKQIKRGSPVGKNLPSEIWILREQNVSNNNERKLVNVEAKMYENGTEELEHLNAAFSTLPNLLCSEADNENGLSKKTSENLESNVVSDGDDWEGPSFRVTCNRAGSHHVFGSSEAARQLGAAVNERFSWPVRLDTFQIEVVLNITDSTVHVLLSLTREPLFKRNLVAFGPTALRATLSYALVHLGRPIPGDVVLDHMCGGGSIPIEGSLSMPSSFYLGGDIHEKAVERMRENLNFSVFNRKLSIPADSAAWDATRLPLRTGCIDVVVSDLPFGKRSGSRLDNRVLYLRTLAELARVTRPNTGRAVLLTHDRKSLDKNLQKVRQYWKVPSVRSVNIGGLHAGVFLLLRTAVHFIGSSLKGVSKSPHAVK